MEEQQLEVKDLEGRSLEVTDLDEAIIEANQAIHFLTYKSGIKYPDVLKGWKHTLKELNKLKNR